MACNWLSQGAFTPSLHCVTIKPGLVPMGQPVIVEERSSWKVPWRSGVTARSLRSSLGSGTPDLLEVAAGPRQGPRGTRGSAGNEDANTSLGARYCVGQGRAFQ